MVAVTFSLSSLFHAVKSRSIHDPLGGVERTACPYELKMRSMAQESTSGHSKPFHAPIPQYRLCADKPVQFPVNL